MTSNILFYDRYMSRDVDSDDDMEVTGLELEREEMRRCEFSAGACRVLPIAYLLRQRAHCKA